MRRIAFVLATLWVLPVASAWAQTTLVADVSAGFRAVGVIHTGETTTVTLSPTTPDAGASAVVVLDRDGAETERFAIFGQDTGASAHGSGGLAVDVEDNLFVVDVAPPRVLSIDPVTRRQRVYATFPDVAPCLVRASEDACSATRADRPPLPADLAFGVDGTLYVTDTQQALIWAIPPDGEPAVWASDPRWDAQRGPTGIAVGADGTVTLATADGSGADGAGGLWRIVTADDGSDPVITELWGAPPGTAPAGLALATSGEIFVGLEGSGEIASVDATGAETGRVGVGPEPRGVTLTGTRALIATADGVRALDSRQQPVPDHRPRVLPPRSANASAPPSPSPTASPTPSDSLSTPGGTGDTSGGGRDGVIGQRLATMLVASGLLALVVAGVGRALVHRRRDRRAARIAR